MWPVSETRPSSFPTEPSSPVSVNARPSPRSSVMILTFRSFVEPSAYVSWRSYSTRMSSCPPLKRTARPVVLSTTAFGSVWTRPGGDGAATCRRLNASATATATPTTISARTIRAHFCQRIVNLWFEDLRLRGSHVRERELDEGLAIEFILLQRERHVDGGLVLGQVVVPLGGAPRDGPEDPALLLERHLEMTF